MNDTCRIEALWFERGTAADAAAATNLHRASTDKISAQRIREIWERAKAQGRLPPFDRPIDGFRSNQSSILRRFMALGMGRAA